VASLFNSKIFSILWYIVVFGASSYYLASAAKEKNTSRRRVFLLLAVLLPALLSAFRLCGTDLGLNVAIYNYEKTNTWYEIFTSDKRPLYFLLMKVGYLLGGYQSFLFLVSLIPCACVCKSLYDSRGRLCLGLAYTTFLFGCLTTSWNVQRQYIAVGITCFAARYIFSRELLKFVLCIYVAYLFHPSCVVMLAVYPLWTKEQRLPSGWKLFLYYAAAIVFVVGIGSLVKSLPGELGEEYNEYLSGAGTGKNRDFLVNLLWLFIFYRQREKLRTINPKNDYYLALFGLTCVIGLTGFYSPYIKRVALYFSVFQCFLIGSLPLQASNKSQVAQAKGICGVSSVRSIKSASKLKVAQAKKFRRNPLARSGKIASRLKALRAKRFRRIPALKARKNAFRSKIAQAKKYRGIHSDVSFLCDLNTWKTLYLAIVGLFVLVAYILGHANVLPYRFSSWIPDFYGV